MAVSLLDGTRNTRDIWIYDVNKNSKSRLTFDAADDFNPIWSPDGLRITWTSARSERFDLYQKLANGAGAEELLLADDYDKFPWTHTSNGHISYWRTGTGGGGLSVIDMRGRKPAAFATAERTPGYARFSPDGRWLLYEVSPNELGRAQLFVVPYPGPGGKWQLAAEGGQRARWRADGKEIFFLSNNNQLMSAAVSGNASTFNAEAPRPLFDLQARTTGYGRFGSYNYDVTADGQRVLVNQTTSPDGGPPPTVTTNWPALMGPQ